MEPTDQLIDELYIDKVRAARRMPLGEKLFAGATLFAYACETARIGIRAQHPHADAEEVEKLLRKRLELGRQLEAPGRGGMLVTELEVVIAVVKALESVRIPYMIVGSFSSNAYGIPRSTKDADFVVQLGDAPLSSLLKYLPEGFRLEAQIGFETITSTTRYRMHFEPLMFMIELFEVSEDAHDQSRFQRRCQTSAYGVPTFLPTPEDVVITKLRWSKGGRRRKDMEDIENVLAVQAGTLDLHYMRGWADAHGTRELLEKALTRLPPGSA